MCEQYCYRLAILNWWQLPTLGILICFAMIMAKSITLKKLDGCSADDEELPKGHNRQM